MSKPNVIFPNESRPDLATGLTRSVLLGGVKYIAGKLFPAINVPEQSGTFSAAQVITTTAEKNRAAGTALTGTRVLSKNVLYSCDKYEGRAFVNETDIKNFGGVDPATAGATRVSGQAVIKAIEIASSGLIMTAARYAAAMVIYEANPLATLGAAAQSVKKYGKAYLVCSESWINNFIKLPTVVEILKDFFGHDIYKVLSDDVEKISMGLGVTLGVAGILIGDDEFWNVEGMEDGAAVVALRPEMESDALMTAKALPCFGASAVFLPDMAKADEPFFVDTVYLSGTKENAVDVTAFLQLMIINEAGCKLVKLPPAEVTTEPTETETTEEPTEPTETETPEEPTEP